VAALLDWFAAHARDLPWRRTRDPYAIWVSEIMLQQTQVRTVLPYWERWMRELPTIESAARAGSNQIHKLWEGLGYYARARNLQRAARVILEKHCGRFPKNFKDVLALPGIGRYTAGAICSIAFNQPTPVLDGNVIRVLTRIFGVAENPRRLETRRRLWRLAEELVRRAPQAEKSNGKFPPRSSRRTNCCSRLNQSLMELGALVCTPRVPRCEICPVRKLCVAFRENRVAEWPNLGKGIKATPRRFVAFVIERNGKCLVRRRPAGVVNAHLWEFPNIEVNGAPVQAEEIFRNEFGFVPRKLTPLATVKHSITRYRMTLEAYWVSVGGRKFPAPPSPSPKPDRRERGIWLAPRQWSLLAFAAAHKKLAMLTANRMLAGQ
jgi:A/G-specific adenine glycosylase